MYGLSAAKKGTVRYRGLGQRPDTPEEMYEWEKQKEEEEHAYWREQFSKAREQYPGLPSEEAYALYQRSEQAERETSAVLKESWPILAAIGAGLLIMTFLGKRRR